VLTCLSNARNLVRSLRIFCSSSTAKILYTWRAIALSLCRGDTPWSPKGKGRHRVRPLQEAKLTLCGYKIRFLAKNSNARYTKFHRIRDVRKITINL